jgi:hypothetical protein
MRFSTRTKDFSEIDSYVSALSGEEQKMKLLKLAEKLV